MNTGIRSVRQELGNIAENKVMGWLLWHNIPFERVGQENWLPNWVHGKIRFVHGDERVDTIRHFPDLATLTALIQVKNAPKSNDYKDVTIEIPSYETSADLFNAGVPVLIVWYMQDRTLKAQWVNKIKVREPSIDRTEANGSMTPFYLVPKDLLIDLKEFKKDLTNGR